MRTLSTRVPRKSLLFVLAVSAIGAGSVIAAGFPSENGALTYSGRLTDSAGNPRTTTESISVTLFSAVSGGQSLCAASQPAVDLSATQGRFQVPLPELCLDAIADTGDVWAEVKVGATTLPRQKLGAVPFAVSAREAQTADYAAEAGTADFATSATSATTATTAGHATTATSASTATTATTATTAGTANAVAPNAVTSAGLQPGSVDATKIAPGAVGPDQLSASVASAIAEVAGLSTRVDSFDSALDIEGGVMRLPNQPFVDWQFEVTLSTTAATIKGGTEIVDRAGEFDPATGIFTASKSGLYLLTGMVYTNNIDDQCGFALSFYKNGGVQVSGHVIMYQSLAAGLDNVAGTVSRIYQMNPGDTAYIIARSGGSCSVASVILVGNLQFAFLH